MRRHIVTLVVLLLAISTWAWRAESFTNRTQWMEDLDDDLLITQLSIPGTHDSATDYAHCHENSAIVPIIEDVSCQTHNIPNQMEMGIRFFDIRLDDDLEFRHKIYDLEQDFSYALDTAQTFLQENPSEFLIFLVKHEHGDASPDAFWKSITEELSNYPSDLFCLNKEVYTVGDARGSIIFMARDESSYPQGYNVDWNNNTTYDKKWDGDLTYVVEDHFSLASVSNATKYREARQNITLARMCAECPDCCDDKTLFITFLSGEGDGLGKDPGHYASYQNPHINDWLKDGAQYGSRSGIVVMDYAGDDKYKGDDLIGTIISQN